MKSLTRLHHGPITNIQYNNIYLKNNHKLRLKYNLFLTSSYDWNINLWYNHISNNKCKLLFNFKFDDYVYDVQWNNKLPNIFASVDGSGNLTIYDLNKNFQVPVYKKNFVNKAIGVLTKCAV